MKKIRKENGIMWLMLMALLVSGVAFAAVESDLKIRVANPGVP
jgi:hypothetical protein